MNQVNLNKKSVKQQGGASMMQPMMQPQQQVDPAIQQISQFFAEAVEQGGQPEEIVINLMQQEVDQNTIAQALITVGYQEADITALFESVQQMTQPKPANAREVNRNPQELARNQKIAEEQQGAVAVDPIDMAKSGIEIKPENKGKFTRWAKSRNMSVSEAANTVMNNTDSYPPGVVKMANFAKNAAKFKKQEGAEIQKLSPDGRNIITEKDGMIILTDNPYDNQDAKSQLQDIETQLKLLQLQYATKLKIAKAQEQYNAKKALLNEQKEGGEFKPHFMYKGKRKIRAKDMATHLRLKDAGYNHKAQDGVEVTDEMITNATVTGADAIDPVITAPALTPEQVKQNELMSTFLKASNVNSINGKNVDGSINKKDEGIIGNTNYFSPNAFKTGNNFSLGKAANVLNEGYTNMFSGKDEDGDGVKDGSFRDWKGKTERNKANKLANTTYDVELDFSQENKDAANAWKTQWDIENPEKDALGNLIEQQEIDDQGNVIIKEQPIDAFTSWLNKGSEGLKGKALETFNSLRNKYRNNKKEEVITVQKFGSELPKALFGFGKRANKAMEDPMSVARVAAGDFSAIQNLMMNGGPLTKAQYSVPDNGAPLATPVQGPITFEEWEALKNQSVSQESNPFVDQADATMPNPVTVTPASNPSTQRSAEDLFGDIKGPEFTANTGGLEGATDRFINSKVMTAFGDVSDFAVKGADVVNDWFEDKNIKDAKDDMRANLTADNIYGTKTDAFNKRGTFDVNSGIMGSEGDRTTGLYMSKQGGGINNAGFKALPDFVQHNILSNMAGGGEAAYLANRDRVIKREMAKAQFGNGETEGMRQREGSYNPPNRKYTLDPRFKKQGGEIVNVDSAMLAKLIAAGANIEIL
jgi:hypothetical protein